MSTQINIKSVETLPEVRDDSSTVKVSAAKLKEIGEKCKTRLEQLKTGRREAKYDEDRQLDFDSYHLVPPKKSLPYQGYPNLCCPLPRITTDTFHANVMFTFGGQEGTFKVLPDFLSRSHMDVARRAAEYLTYVLNYEANLYDALDKADLDANKYNNGYLKSRYVRKYEWESREVITEEVVPEINELTGEVKAKTVRKKKTERIKKTVFDGTKVERVDPAMVYASPMFETVEEAVEKDFLFEVANYNMRFVNEMAVKDEDGVSFFNADKVKAIKDMRRGEILSRLEQTKKEYDGYAVERELELTPLELATAYFREDINDDGLAEHVTAVFETTTGIILRLTYGKCRIVKISPRPIDGRWDSESIRKAGQSLIIEWEAIHNQRVAKGQWSNLPFFFYKQGGRFNPQVLTLMPGKGYPTDDPNAVNFPQPPPPDPSYFNEERLLMDYFDRVFAIGDSIQGVAKGGETATGTIQSAQRAGIRLSNPINRIGRALEKLIGDIWELNRECAPQEKEYRVVGCGDGVPVFNKITSADYNALVSFKLNMATTYDVQMLRDTALLNYRTFISNPIVMSNPATFYQLTQDTMNATGMKIKLPVPEQAKAKSAFEVIDLIREGEDQEPTLGIDADEHMKVVMSVIKGEEFKDWPADRQKSLFLYYDKCQILKKTLETANLNQSGVFEGMNGMNANGTPAFTANKNPTQQFNTMKVGETQKSQVQNLQNGQQGGGY